MSCDNQDSINSLFNNLTRDYTSNFPNIDWDDVAFQIPPELLKAITKETTSVEISDVTIKKFDGTGSFDVLMSSISNHLREEFRANRITGSEYSKVWVGGLETAIQQAIGFALNKDDATWKGINAQLQAITAMANLKLIQAQISAMKQDEALKKAQYGLTKAQILSQEIQQCLLKEQIETERANTLDVRTDGVTPITGSIGKQKDLLTQQTISQEVQQSLMREQIETERSNTLDFRSDNVTPITGSVGKQKDLYAQQIVAYQRDSELKAAKVWADAWAVIETITKSDILPDTFKNPSVQSVMESLRSKAGI